MRSAEPRSSKSLTARLLVRCLGALVVMAAVLTALEFTNAIIFPETGTAIFLSQEAQKIGDALEFDAAGNVHFSIGMTRDSAWLYDAMPTEIAYRILDAGGHVQASSSANDEPLTPPGRPFELGLDEFQATLGGSALRARTLAVPHGATNVFVQVAVSPRLARLAIFGLGSRYLVPRFVNVLLSIVIFTIVILVTLRRELRPLREASKAAEGITPSNLAGRVDTHNMPREIVPLVHAFNLALDRLESGFKVQQQFLATAAHELKTPLALIRGQIELAGPDADLTVLKDIDFMARQVQQLLHLAEVSEPGNFTVVPIDRATVAREVVHFLTRLAAQHSVRIKLEAASGLPLIQADGSALFVLLKNLIENAIFHSPANGEVRVALSAFQLVIEDRGAGLPAEHLDKLFMPFWRGKEREHTGAGLGLAICRQIADAHGWKLTGMSGDVGARFTVSFAATSVRPA